MASANIARTTYRVADFLTWQRNDQLRLSPAFQRRSVWKPGQKSYLLDTVIRGLPMPLVFVRDSINLEAKTSVKEMVDGQQRVRTLLAYVDPQCLDDFDSVRDSFTIRSTHNEELGGRTFAQLPVSIQRDVLSYEISTHVLPLDFEDRDVLKLFARMNSTGLKLNPQELRNAEYSGEAKTICYELATEQLDRWRSWGVFSEEQISRMKEVELVSDLILNITEGLRGKTQAQLNNFYAVHEETWPSREVCADRFRRTMDSLERLLGSRIKGSAWQSEVNFFTLFAVVADLEWQLGSDLTVKKSRPLPQGASAKLLELGARLRSGRVPTKVLDAMQRASADLGRRRTRFEFVRNALQAG